MTTDDPVARLSAGLAEEERIAREFRENLWDGKATRAYLARQDPETTLRRVEAIRKVLAEHGRNSYGQCETCRDYDFRYDYDPVPWPCPTVRALAGIYLEEQS